MADIFPSQHGEWLGGKLSGGGVPHVFAALVLPDRKGYGFGMLITILLDCSISGSKHHCVELVVSMFLHQSVLI